MPRQDAVGVASVTIVESNALGLVRFSAPVFNLPPQQGEPARLGIMLVATPVLIDTSVDPDNGYRLDVSVRNVPQAIQFLSSTTTIWGTPGDPAHDSSRGWNCTYFGKSVPGECESPPAGDREVPFLRMPDSCRGPLGYEARLEPWNVPPGSARVDARLLRAPSSSPATRSPLPPSLGRAHQPPRRRAPRALTSGSASRAPGPNSSANTPEAQPERVEVTLPEGVTHQPLPGRRPRHLLARRPRPRAL